MNVPHCCKDLQQYIRILYIPLYDIPLSIVLPLHWSTAVPAAVAYHPYCCTTKVSGCEEQQKYLPSCHTYHTYRITLMYYTAVKCCTYDTGVHTCAYMCYEYHTYRYTYNTFSVYWSTTYARLESPSYFIQYDNTREVRSWVLPGNAQALPGTPLVLYDIARSGSKK